MHLEINRRDIRQTRLMATAVSPDLPPNHVAMRLESAALTSNNVSYALSGDMLDYWGFFPTEEGWGRLPVMGFGVVTASNCAEVPVGGRYFGFFPLGDHHVVHAQSSRSGFVDAAPWREKHAMAYRSYERAETNPLDDSILIFRGLFLTSFLFEDFVRERGNFGAQQMVITSASSKTSIALAHCVKTNSNLRVVGLTSAANAAFVETVGEYDDVITYTELDSMRKSPSIVVDMAGDPRIIGKVHALLPNLVVHSASVGATHWNAERSDMPIPSPRPEFFFAPSQLAKRGKELGREEVDRRISDALAIFVAGSARWMTIRRTRGAEGVVGVYDELVAGNVDPSLGHIVMFD